MCHSTIWIVLHHTFHGQVELGVGHELGEVSIESAVLFVISASKAGCMGGYGPASAAKFVLWLCLGLAFCVHIVSWWEGHNLSVCQEQHYLHVCWIHWRITCHGWTITQYRTWQWQKHGIQGMLCNVLPKHMPYSSGVAFLNNDLFQ